MTGAIFGGVFSFILAGGGSCPFLPSPAREGSAAPYVSSLPALTAETFDGAVADGVVLVDFWAAWCGPCQRQLPILDALAPEVSEQFAIVKVNVDEQPELAKTYGISRLPTLVFFRAGKPVRTLVGTQSPEALKKAFAELPGGDS
ncbi:MAG: thioredoxin [Lentisphaeria bacterium]|nr:thioredoxin [Lentisphaeria bacterium]